MPILYYRANPAGTTHLAEFDAEGAAQSATSDFYNYTDNWGLIKLGVPFNSNLKHKLGYNGQSVLDAEAVFVGNTTNTMINLSAGAPYRSDSYILISAGHDGLYGTRDDLYNFDN